MYWQNSSRGAIFNSNICWNPPFPHTENVYTVSMYHKTNIHGWWHFSCRCDPISTPMSLLNLILNFVCPTLVWLSQIWSRTTTTTDSTYADNGWQTRFSSNANCEPNQHMTQNEVRNAPQFSKTKNVLHWQLSGFVYLHTFFSLSNILCKLFPVRNFRKLLFISSKTCTNIGMCTMCQLPSNTIKKGLRPIATTGLFCLFCSVAHLHFLVKATWVQFLKLKQICCLFNPFQIILYQTALSGPPNASCLPLSMPDFMRLYFWLFST